MHAGDVLRYGQQAFLSDVNSVPETQREMQGACGTWSVKDLVSHLGSYELVLVDVLRSLVNGGPTPHLDRFVQQGADFNDAEVDARRDRSFADVMTELGDAHEETLRLIAALRPEDLRRTGTIPWYGDEYAVDDLICYQYYGHKREHAAQIAMFRDHVVYRESAQGA